jgi:hypothetical protein
MNDRENRRYQMFGRVQTFGQNHQTDFASDSKAARHFAAIGQVILDIDAAKAIQQSGDTTAREVLLDGLRLDLQNIARTARAIEQDEPGFAAKFRPPDSPSQTALLTATDAVIAELKKPDVAAKFIVHELPADFVKNLEDDRKAIDAAQDTVESDDAESVKSTAAIGRLIRAGMKEVNYLDAIMHNKYARNPDKLRAWQSASHIERAPQREKKPAVAVVTPNPATPQTQAA